LILNFKRRLIWILQIYFQQLIGRRQAGICLGQGSWFQVIIFSFLQVGLLISVILSFLPAEIASELLPITKDIFTSDKAQFAWLLAPILAMIIIGRGGKLE